VSALLLALAALGVASVVAMALGVVDARRGGAETRAVLGDWARRTRAKPLATDGFRVVVDGAPLDVTATDAGLCTRARYALGHGPRYEAVCFATTERVFPMPGAHLATAVREDYTFHGDVAAALRRLTAAFEHWAPAAPVDPPRVDADGTYVIVTTSTRDGELGLELGRRLAARLALDDVALTAPMTRVLGAPAAIAAHGPGAGLASIDVVGRVPLRVTPRIAPDGSVLTRFRATLVRERTVPWRHPFDGPADEASSVLVGRAAANVPLAALAVAGDVRVVLDLDAMEIVVPRFPSMDEVRAAVELVEILLAPPPSGPFR
jgi:hypothetical protein